MSTNVRRVVATFGEDGRSHVVLDGPAPQVVPQPGRGLVFHELWATDGPLTDDGTEADPGNRVPSHHPVMGGTKLRIVEFLPDSVRDPAAVHGDLDRIGAASIATSHSDDPTFHANDTVDYNIVLSGEIYAVTETEERLLRAGDVLVQRGTAHTWSNRSNAPCVYASVMVSATPWTGRGAS